MLGWKKKFKINFLYIHSTYSSFSQSVELTIRVNARRLLIFRFFWVYKDTHTHEHLVFVFMIGIGCACVRCLAIKMMNNNKTKKMEQKTTNHVRLISCKCISWFVPIFIRSSTLNHIVISMDIGSFLVCMCVRVCDFIMLNETEWKCSRMVESVIASRNDF